jgi:hypothetical protein
VIPAGPFAVLILNVMPETHQRCCKSPALSARAS